MLKISTFNTSHTTFNSKPTSNKLVSEKLCKLANFEPPKITKDKTFEPIKQHNKEMIKFIEKMSSCKLSGQKNERFLK